MKFLYSERYQDDQFIYRHVQVPKQVYHRMKRRGLARRLLSEEQVRSLGVQQSLGWEHYHVHKPEPYVLLFRRPK